MFFIKEHWVHPNDVKQGRGEMLSNANDIIVNESAIASSTSVSVNARDHAIAERRNVLESCTSARKNGAKGMKLSWSGC